jgi:hypothetical protein
MSNNPFLNAGAATTYIILLVSAGYFGSMLVTHEDSIIAPMIFLSVFVLSAAMMAYFFFFHPFRLLIEGRSKESGAFFLKTVVVFACFTGILLSALLFLSA